MAADGTSIKNDIDNELANKGYRGVRVVNVISALKKTVDWVTSSINNHLTSWNKVGTEGPAGANSDNVYRTGKVIIGRTTDDGENAHLLVEGLLKARQGVKTQTRQNNTNPLAAQEFGNLSGLHIQGASGGNVAFMEFHVPGLLIHQFGVDTDGLIKLHPWSTSSSYAALFDGYNTKMATNNVLANRKVVLYDTLNNDHQYYGFGVNASALRYQVPSFTDAHVFYSGNTPATSREILRLKGNGDVSIYDGNFEVSSVSNPIVGVRLNLIDNVVTNSVFGEFRFQASAGASRYSSIRGLVGQFSDQVGLAFFTNTGAANYREAARFVPSGYFGLGTTNPTSLLHVKGVAGHDQLRLETPYTPTGSGDATGQLGNIAWDTNYIYVKTSGGWRRTGLSSW